MLPAVSRRWLVVLLALGGGALASAQDRPVLHEYVPDVGADEEVSLVTGDGPEPEAIVYDGEVLPAPEGGGLRDDEVPMRAVPGDSTGREEAGRRSPSFRPDRQTELEGTLGYFTVFSPSIAPFKRVTSLDAVALAEDGVTPYLRVRDLSTRAVPLESANAAPADDRPRDRFWGSVVLDFTTGELVPLPSVSPESRILSLRTEPEADVRIERDAADNYFARLVGGGRGEPVRLVFLTDAPQGYFNQPIPDARTDAEAERVAPLPPSVQQRAERLFGPLGLRRGAPLRDNLEQLVAHFRSFEESDEPPADTGDIFTDLTLGRRGICRHRAYGFVILAHALGVPARFVHNEAHAWVEVSLAGAGWMRIDLGGAARGLEPSGDRDGPVYRPREPDPLPRPLEYERAYAQGRGRMSRGRVAGTTDMSDGPGAGGEPATPGAAPAPLTPGAPADPERSPLVLQVHQRAYSVLRGRALEVSGQVDDLSGVGVPGMRVEAMLRRGTRELLLGVTVSRDNGSFRASFGVPPELEVGDYQLLVRTPGDEHHAPATAR